MSIPLIDFAHFDTEPEKVAQRVFEACTSIGFFYMIHHSVPHADIVQAFKLSKAYFDQSAEEKRKAAGVNNHGYFELYQESLDPEHQQCGDNKESLNVRNFAHGKPFAPLPALFATHAAFVERFSRECHEAAMCVLEAFAIALKIPDEQGGQNWFKDRHHYDGVSGEVLRLLKYPRGGKASDDRSVQAGAHSDYGSISLLFQNGVPGLEVQANRAEWISAPLIENAILVNVGDLMEFWTNGLFKSTLHRVVFLPEHQHLDRYSIPFFVHPEDDVPLVPIPSTLVPSATLRTQNDKTAGEHLQEKLNASYKTNKA